MYRLSPARPERDLALVTNRTAPSGWGRESSRCRVSITDMTRGRIAPNAALGAIRESGLKGRCFAPTPARHRSLFNDLRIRL